MIFVAFKVTNIRQVAAAWQVAYNLRRGNRVNLSVQLAPRNPRGLLLVNPVMTASGTCGYGTEPSHLFDIQKLGALVCKGTTLESKPGNPQPRIVETASGMLNSIGLENIGVKSLIKDKAPIWGGRGPARLSQPAG